MVHLFVQLSKYLTMLLILFYTYSCFHIIVETEVKKQKRLYRLQRLLAFAIHLDGYAVLYQTTGDIRMIYFFLAQVGAFLFLQAGYHHFYKHRSELVLNNMCMLLIIGMIMLARLNFARAVRQFVFVCAGIVISLIIPAVMKQVSMFRKLAFLYAAAGISSLAVVAFRGGISYGAKLSISLFGFSFMPSEFVKILFVFFTAAMMHSRNDWKRFFFTSFICAAFVLLLVFCNDLGGALIYFFAYLIIMYVATGRAVILITGTAFIPMIGVLAYHFVSHVRTRIVAWLDPMAVYDTMGYQISQSLFAIGTGSWFGTGLNQGMPEKIPVVTSDFIFSAISEELGGIFAFCLVLVCVSMFLMIFNVALQLKNPFYELVAVGLGSIYATQVFLMIGGVIKFIPSTGLTLPLVSYGGSSMLSSMLMFGIIQALYIRHHQMNLEG